MMILKNVIKILYKILQKDKNNISNMRMNIFMIYSLKKKLKKIVLMINNKVVKNYVNLRIKIILIQDQIYNLRKKKFLKDIFDFR